VKELIGIRDRRFTIGSDRATNPVRALEQLMDFAADMRPGAELWELKASRKWDGGYDVEATFSTPDEDDSK